MNHKYGKSIIFIVFFQMFFLMVFQLQGVAADKIVPVELSRKAALHYAGEIFGQVRYFDHTTYFNLDDEPIVYVFTLYKKSGPLPDIAEIKSNVYAYRVKRLEIEKSINDWPLSERTDKRAEIKNYWTKMRHEEDFVTVIASTTYDQVPIIEMYAGLPPHIVASEDAKEIARTVLDKTSIRLEKLRYVAPLRFEFEYADSFGKSTLVSPLDFQIRDISILRQKKSGEIEIKPEQRTIIEEKWRKVELLSDQKEGDPQKEFTTITKREETKDHSTSVQIESGKGKASQTQKIEKKEYQENLDGGINPPEELNPSLISSIQATTTGILELSSGTQNYVINDLYYLWVQLWNSSGAPAGAWVTNVEYRLRIDDNGDPSTFYCGDYAIYLSSEANGAPNKYLLVYNHLGTRTDGGYDDDTEDDSDIYINWRSTSAFNGENPNQKWCVWVEDTLSGDSGIMSYIEFKIHWEAVIPKPNLTPYQPSGWGDKIVVSNITGTYTDSTITQGEVSYIDVAWINNGDVDAGYHISRLYLDGVQIKWTEAPDLLLGYYRHGDDWEYTFADSGWHTLRLVVDSDNNIDESNEGDNVYERSIYVEPSEVIISGVPDYQQNDYPGPGDCSPTAAACVLGYWDSHGYSNLVDSGNVAQLVQDLKDNSNYDSVNGGTTDVYMAESIEIVCNDPDLNNNYGFSATYNDSALYSEFKDEISAGRPMVHITYGHSTYRNHSMTGVGYSEPSGTQWCIDHDNWETTGENVYVEWNSISDNMTKIVPGAANNKTISGYVRTSSSFGISGVTITFSHYDYQSSTWISDGTATTDSNGYYSFSAYYCWNGRATPSKSGFSFSPTYITHNDLISNQSNQNYTGYPPANPIISGYVKTSSGSGISDVTMTFNNGGGTTTTNTSGYYSNSVAYGWSGSVTPSKTGYTFSPTNRSYSAVIANQSNQDYTGTPPSNPIISGYVQTSSGIGISNVTMTFSNGGGATTTNTSGYYSNSVAYGWSGSVTPSKTDYTFSPTNRSYSNVTSDQSSQNYTGTPVSTYGYSLLWTRDASAHLWKFNPSGDWAGATGYGYSSGWTATTYQRNSDGSAQLLWTRDGSAHLWKFNSSGGWAGATGYGYAPGWTATCYQRNNDGSAQLLWTNNGSAHLWKFNSSGGWAGAIGYGYASGWTATTYQRNGDGSAQLLWTNNGSAHLWKFNSSGGWAGATGYGYSSGWTATSYQRNGDGSAQLLWTSNGSAHLWKFNASGGWVGATGFGYTSGWTATCYHNGTGSLTAAQQLSEIMLNYATDWTGTSYLSRIEPDISMNYEDIPGDFPGEVIQNPDDIVNEVNFAQQFQEDFEIYNKLEAPYIIIKKAGTGGGAVASNGLMCDKYCMELIIPYDKNAMETLQVIPDDDSYFLGWETSKGVPLENIQDAQPGEVVIAVFDIK
jgi:hypothetical protein